MTPRDRKYAVSAGMAVLLGVLAGFYMIGSPVRQRDVEADRRRSESLQSISAMLHDQSQVALPDSLAALTARSDPVTGEPYEYRKIDENRYELCATFATDTRAEAGRGPGLRSFRAHSAGRWCYDLDRRNPAY